MSSPQLTTIAAELQAAIVQWILLPDDLKVLRTVCKILEPHATAKFYRMVSIDLFNWHGHPIYSRYIPVHHHIRHLKFTIKRKWVPHEHYESEETMRQGVQELLVLLPHDVSKSFYMDSMMRVDRATLLLLAATQRDLTGLCIGPLHDSYLALPAILKPWPRYLSLLDAGRYVGGDGDYHSYHDMINNAKNIDTIIFRWGEPGPEYEREHVRTLDSEMFGGHISRTLRRAPTLQSAAYCKIDMSTLSLHFVELSYSDRTFARDIDFCRLRYLDLHDCTDASVLLRLLTAEFRRRAPALRGFLLCSTLAIERTDTGSFDLKVLLSFIERLNDLEYLSLDIRALTGKFDLKCLDAHAATLSRLYLSIGIRLTEETEPRRIAAQVIPLAELRVFCSRFRELSQFGIPLPEVDFLDWDSEKNRQYMEYMHVLSALPKLKVFRSLTWPIVPTLCVREPVNGVQKLNKAVFGKHLLAFTQKFAGILFALSPMSRLNLISYGDKEEKLLKIAGGGEAFCPGSLYLIQRQVGMVEGELQVVPVKRSLVQYFVPEASCCLLPADYCDWQVEEQEQA